jgi:hypothetical protein
MLPAGFPARPGQKSPAILGQTAPAITTGIPKLYNELHVDFSGHSFGLPSLDLELCSWCNTSERKTKKNKS